MPNWCFAVLKVECKLKNSDKYLEDFAEFAKSKDKDGNDVVLTTEKFIPYPKKKQYYIDKWKKGEGKSHFENPDNEWFNDGDGYNWCLKHWGTKWGICEPHLIQMTAQRILYHFETAWSPCKPVIERMAKMFPKLDFIYKYWERGMGYKGYMKFSKGKLVKQTQYRYGGELGG